MGASCALFGRLLDALGPLIGISQASWVYLGPSRLDLGSILEGFGKVLEANFEHVFWTLDLHSALIAVGTSCWHSPGLFVAPCSAAVRAQHIRRLPKGRRACQM